jgi:hypothetical protein
LRLFFSSQAVGVFSAVSFSFFLLRLHTELGVRGSVQVVSAERGPSVGATSAFCRRPGRLLRPSAASSSSSSSSFSSYFSSGSGAGLAAPNDAPTVVLAFGDASLCKPLLQSAAAAGVSVELLKYEKHLGHRQMVHARSSGGRGLGLV